MTDEDLIERELQTWADDSTLLLKLRALRSEANDQLARSVNSQQRSTIAFWIAVLLLLVSFVVGMSAPLLIAAMLAVGSFVSEAVAGMHSNANFHDRQSAYRWVVLIGILRKSKHAPRDTRAEDTR